MLNLQTATPTAFFPMQKAIPIGDDWSMASSTSMVPTTSQCRMGPKAGPALVKYPKVSPFLPCGCDEALSRSAAPGEGPIGGIIAAGGGGVIGAPGRSVPKFDAIGIERMPLERTSPRWLSERVPASWGSARGGRQSGFRGELGHLGTIEPLAMSFGRGQVPLGDL